MRDELNYQDIRIKELTKITGISAGTLNHYLAEKSTEPTVENAVKIAKALNVSVEYLVCGEDSSFAKNEKSDFDIKLYKKYETILKKLDTLQPSSIQAVDRLLENLK